MFTPPSSDSTARCFFSQDSFFFRETKIGYRNWMQSGLWGRFKWPKINGFFSWGEITSVSGVKYNPTVITGDFGLPTLGEKKGTLKKADLEPLLQLGGSSQGEVSG